MKIKSMDELDNIKSRYLNKIILREHVEGNIDKEVFEIENIENKEVKYNILICGGTGCLSTESDKVKRNFELILKARGYENKVEAISTGCFGFCEQGPIVKIEPDNVFYVKVSPKDVKDIVDQHIVEGKQIKRLLYEDPLTNKKIEKQLEIPFYHKQIRVALRNCGLINPEDIYEYIALEGYKALGKVLTEMSRDEVIDVIKKSGLRGRGGGGFSTGLKWELTKKTK